MLPQQKAAYQYFLTEATQKNNGFAKSFLAVIYMNGWSVAKDETQELKWTQESAQQNNSMGQYNLADLYYFGKRCGIEKDFKRAYDLLILSAGQGNPWAQAKLGDIYRIGKEVPHSSKTAATYFRSAAEQGFPYAQCSLALMCLEGDEVPQSDEETIKWLRLAQENGSKLVDSIIKEAEMLLEQRLEAAQRMTLPFAAPVQFQHQQFQSYQQAPAEVKHNDRPGDQIVISKADLAQLIAQQVRAGLMSAAAGNNADVAASMNQPLLQQSRAPGYGSSSS